MCVPVTHTNLILIDLSGASRVLFFIKSIALFTAFTAGRGLAVGIKFFLRNPARCERSCEQFFFVFLTWDRCLSSVSWTLLPCC